MLNLAWANKTPWDTPRECQEEELAEKIRVLAEQVEDMDRAIFNIHVPPYGTGLDTAPELEEGARLKRGGAITGPVGSTAVGDAILTLSAAALPARSHPRVARDPAARPDALDQPRKLLLGLVAPGRRRRPRRGKVKRAVPVTG